MSVPVQTAGVASRATNSYDFVRFCAASAVFFSHHFDLAGYPEPQVPGYGEDFGILGVEIFFCLSGFLICLSLQRSRNWGRFAAARILRIFPNLLFVLVVTSATTFFWYHNTAHLELHVGYVVDNLLMFVKGVTQVIPGVFTDTIRPTINEPLWTLPYELWLYVLLALIFFLFGRRTGTGVVLIALLLGAAWSAADLLGDFDIGPLESFDLFQLGSYFMSGAVLAAFWPYLKQHAIAIGVAGLLGIVVLQAVALPRSILLALAVAAATAGLGSSKAMSWFSKGGDASYGMYIFAWPVQQFSILLIGSFWLSMLIAFLIITALGYATWHAFEMRAMTYPDRIVAWIGARRSA